MSGASSAARTTMMMTMRPVTAVRSLRKRRQKLPMARVRRNRYALSRDEVCGRELEPVEDIVMRICVVGAGAIGGLLAAKLHAAGEKVTVIARGRHLEAIKTHRLKLIDGESEIAASAAATDRLAEAGEQALVILPVKAHHIADVAGDLAKTYGRGTMVLTAQNGIPW